MVNNWIFLTCQRKQILYKQFNSILLPYYNWRRDRLPTAIFLGFPCDSAGKESACNVGDLDLMPGLWRSPEEGKGYPLQHSGLENSMHCIVHRVAKSWTWLNDFLSPYKWWRLSDLFKTVLKCETKIQTQFLLILTEDSTSKFSIQMLNLSLYLHIFQAGNRNSSRYWS